MWIGVAIKSHRPRFRAGKGIRLEREQQGFSGETCSRVEIQSANGREVSRSGRDNENRIGNGSKAGIFSPRRSFFFDKASYVYIYIYISTYRPLRCRARNEWLWIFEDSKRFQSLVSFLRLGLNSTCPEALQSPIKRHLFSPLLGNRKTRFAN